MKFIAEGLDIEQNAVVRIEADSYPEFREKVAEFCRGVDPCVVAVDVYLEEGDLRREMRAEYLSGIMSLWHHRSMAVNAHFN